MTKKNENKSEKFTPIKEKNVKETQVKKFEEQPMTVESLVAKAIEQNASMEVVERMVALMERVKSNQAKEAFDRAMAEFQAECPVISKTKAVYEKGSTTKVRYSYAGIDSIVSQTRGLLGEKGLSYKIQTKNDEKMLTVICIITHISGHSESTEFAVPIGNEAYMSDVQKYGARLTFAKRYAFCNALGIMTGDEDNDATSTIDESKGTSSNEEKVLRFIKSTTDLNSLEDLKKKFAGSDKYDEATKKELTHQIDLRIKEITK